MIRNLYTLLLGLLCTSILFAQSPGSIDPAFNPVDIGHGHGDGPDHIVNTLALQPDGNILIGGLFTYFSGPPTGTTTRNRIARLNANGTLDTSFDPGGGPNSSVNSIVLQPDGGIIIAGTFTTVAGMSRNRIARLLSTGALDNSFTVGSGFNGNVNKVALQSDGKIIVAGAFTSYNDTPCGRIVRLEANGTIDPTFNTGSGFNAVVNNVEILTSGSLLVQGDFNDLNGSSVARIVRLSSSGALDNSYQAVGYWTAMAGLPDGSAYVYGGSWGGISRLGPTGDLDESFETTILTSGWLTAPMRVDLSGRLVLLGWLMVIDGQPSGRLARLNYSGGVDPTLNTEGKFDEPVNAIVFQTSGHMIAAGSFSGYGSKVSNKLVRLNASGMADLAFMTGSGINGRGMLPFYGVERIIEQPDGKFVVGGGFVGYNGIVRRRLLRVTAAGALDNTFDHGTGPNNSVHALALQSDGKILVGGEFTSFNDVPHGRLVRVLTNGQLDPAFNSGSGADNGMVAVVRILPDNSILVGGSFSSYNGVPATGLVRLTSTGTVMAGFIPDLTGNFVNVADIKLRTDGSIWIAGTFAAVNGTPANSIARLDQNGAVVPAFNTGEGFPTVHIRELVERPDGRVLAVGEFTAYNGHTRAHIVQLLANGQVDTGFIPPAGSASKKAIGLQPSGKVLIGGFYDSNGHLFRLNTNGTLDNTFNSQPSFGWYVECLLPLANGQWMVGGTIYELGGTGRNCLMRINAGDLTVNVAAKVFLGGPYGQGPMLSDALRVQALIPQSEPYSGLGFTFFGEGGLESMGTGALNTTGPNAIVDWVVVELRDPSTPSAIVNSKSALVQRDGDVVAMDGVSSLDFNGIPGNYHVAIRHRNHLGVMTAAPVALSASPATIDFTNTSTPTWGTDAQLNVSGTMVLWPGDVNFDGVVKYSGAGNDRDVVLQAIGGSIPSNTLDNVYHSADVNLDGVVKYTGMNNDRDIILQTIGGVVPTAVKVGQVP